MILTEEEPDSILGPAGLRAVPGPGCGAGQVAGVTILPRAHPLAVPALL